ncbi:MAG: hypothetical protein M5U28_34915 [Sandaracinaceae bacterium]|nr:hypothetical protein [Sandaracinaceae bacterium]
MTDVGDEQSIEKNLSTFSAHVTNLARVLDTAGPSAMVLLDEVATGTDPEEGAALACAVVLALCDRGAAVGVTTHYERLKALASRIRACATPRSASTSRGWRPPSRCGSTCPEPRARSPWRAASGCRTA